MDAVNLHTPHFAPGWTAPSLEQAAFRPQAGNGAGACAKCGQQVCQCDPQTGDGRTPLEQTAAGTALAASISPVSAGNRPDTITLTQQSNGHDSRTDNTTSGQPLATGLDTGYGPDARPLQPSLSERDPQNSGDQEHASQEDPGQNRSPGDSANTAGANAEQAGTTGAGNTEEPASAGLVDEEDLNQEDRQTVEELKQRDAEVRAHEQAHISAGGQYVTGGASYSYETGPDGKQYAVGGEVSIDTSQVPGNPEQTEQKAQTVRRAAMAPASPSAQDQKVASQATQMEAEARSDKTTEESREQDIRIQARETGENEEEALQQAQNSGQLETENPARTTVRPDAPTAANKAFSAASQAEENQTNVTQTSVTRTSDTRINESRTNESRTNETSPTEQQSTAASSQPQAADENSLHRPVDQIALRATAAYQNQSGGTPPAQEHTPLSLVL